MENIVLYFPNFQYWHCSDFLSTHRIFIDGNYKNWSLGKLPLVVLANNYFAYVREIYQETVRDSFLDKIQDKVTIINFNSSVKQHRLIEQLQPKQLLPSKAPKTYWNCPNLNTATCLHFDTPCYVCTSRSSKAYNLLNPVNMV